MNNRNDMRMSGEGNALIKPLTASSQSFALPTNEQGDIPKRVAITVFGVAEAVFFNLTAAAGTAVILEDMMITERHGPMIFNITGQGFIQIVSTGVLSTICVQPLDD